MFFLLTLGVGVVPRQAAANSETPLNYDARAVAMGGTGAAYIDNGAASVHNPALLTNVVSSTVTGTFTPFALKLTAPFTFGASSRNVTSGIVFGPFAHAGFATRLSKRFVIGVAAFLTSAAGGDFRKIPLAALDDTGKTPNFVIGNARVAMFAGELQVPLAFWVAPWLQIAAAYRVTYAHAFAHVANINNAPLSDATLSGNDFKGYLASATVRPNEKLTLGLVFRGKVATDLSGKLNTVTSKKGAVALRRANGYQSPYQIRVAASYKFDNFPLRLATDARTWLYHELDRELQNAYAVAVGAEYLVTTRYAVRAGYSLGFQATRPEYARAFAPPPGVGHAFSAGGGLHLTRIDLDAAVGYVTNKSVISPEVAAIHSNPQGTFHARGLIGALSGTYHY